MCLTVQVVRDLSWNDLQDVDMGWVVTNPPHFFMSSPGQMIGGGKLNV